MLCLHSTAFALHTEVPGSVIQAFLEYGHTPSSFTFLILEVLTRKNVSDNDLKKGLLQQETYWTFKFQADYEQSLNSFIDYSPFL